MQPVVAIVGRPNVGKSTLFNCLTRSTRALVADEPGVTRDRLYGVVEFEHHSFILVDTGGIVESGTDLEEQMLQQTRLALQEADVVLWVVDAKTGLLHQDQVIIKSLRTINKPLILVVNKSEGMAPEIASADFQRLGIKQYVATAAAHRGGIHELETAILENLPQREAEPAPVIAPDAIKVALVGRPNVGKSTLTNRLLGEERVVVFDAPGTTRDSIYIPYEKDGKSYVLIDTAGVRRRGRIDEKIEKFSVFKTLRAVEEANVVVLLLDATENITDQDLHLLGFIEQQGKSLIIAVNKWDHLPEDQREFIKSELERRLDFVSYAKIHFISALHGSNVGHLLMSIDQAYASATRVISTSMINDLLAQAVIVHQPPLVRGRRVKLRYAHIGGHNPPTIIVHGNQVASLPRAYQRFLAHFFREKLHLVATPIKIIFREGENPYKDRKNALTQRQYQKRQRLIKQRKKHG